MFIIYRPDNANVAIFHYFCKLIVPTMSGAKFFKTPLTLAFIEDLFTMRRHFYTVRALKGMHVSEDTRRSV